MLHYRRAFSSFKQGNFCPRQGKRRGHSCSLILALPRAANARTYVLTKPGHQTGVFPPSCQIRNLHMEFMQITSSQRAFSLNFWTFPARVPSANNLPYTWVHVDYEWQHYKPCQGENAAERLSIPYSISGHATLWLSLGTKSQHPALGLCHCLFTENKRREGQPEYQGLGDTSLALHCT